MVENLRGWVYRSDIRRALEAMAARGNKSEGFASLRTLSLVDKFLADPAVPTFSNARDIAVFSLLSDIIQELLHHLRSSLSNQATYDEDWGNNIQFDVQSGAPLLIGISILNYCFVEVDRNLSLARYAELAGFSERTARRYFGAGIKKLESTLFEREMEVRNNQLTQTLLSQLPVGAQTTLIGRDTEAREIDSILRNTPQAAIVVFGVGGVGKRTLIQNVLRDQVLNSAASFERLIWVNHPGSYDDLIDEIRLNLPGTLTKHEIKSLSMHSQMCIVIEGAEKLVQDAEQIADVLTWLQFATCIFITDVTPTNFVFDYYLRLFEFNETVSFQLAQMFVERFDQQRIIEVNETDVVQIVGNACGNPRVIERMIYRLCHGAAVGSQRTKATQSNLQNTILDCNSDEFCLWLALCVCQLNTFDIAHLEADWSPLFTDDRLEFLVRHIILEPKGRGMFRLTTSGYQTMIDYLMKDSLDNRDASIRLVASWLWATTSPHLSKNVLAISHLLRLLPDTCKEWVISQVSSEKVKDILQANHMSWHLLFEVVANVDWHFDIETPPSTVFIVSLALFWEKRFDRAHLLIANWQRQEDYAIKSTFTSALSLIDCRLLKVSHQYEQAFEKLNKLRRQKDIPGDVKSLVLEELVGISLDLKDVELARKYLKESKHTSVVLQLLEVEILLLESHADDAIAKLEALPHDVLNDQQVATLHDLYARSHLIKKDLQSAVYFSLEASEQLGAVGDYVGQARVLCNLGVQLFDLGQITEAKYAWEQAQLLQLANGDRIGLAVTKQNMAML